MDEATNNSIVVSARSVDEAVQQALRQLGANADEVEVEVLKHGSRGLLGLLSEEAQVRVTVRRPPAPAELVEGAAPHVESAEAGSAPAGDEGDVALVAADVLQGLLDRMGVRGRVTQEAAPVSADTDAASILLNITGEDLGLLIGRRGETLRDLQFLTCLIVSRKTERWPGLSVDVEHYKFRREKALVDLARRMADRVREDAEPVALEPMPPNERRIVHLTLRDDPDVRTESTGQGERRKVVLFPKE
jgi:spoIIIJ-associated protein